MGSKVASSKESFRAMDINRVHFEGGVQQPFPAIADGAYRIPGDPLGVLTAGGKSGDHRGHAKTHPLDLLRSAKGARGGRAGRMVTSKNKSMGAGGGQHRRA